MPIRFATNFFQIHRKSLFQWVKSGTDSNDGNLNKPRDLHPDVTTKVSSSKIHSAPEKRTLFQ